MADVEVHIDLDGRSEPLGLLRRRSGRGAETVTFAYDDAWLANANRFSIEPALRLGVGSFPPMGGRGLYGSIGDSAPDTWGRQLMRRAERRRAVVSGTRVRTLSELDYLLGVCDETRLGALRFCPVGNEDFVAPLHAGIPPRVDLRRLLTITDRVLRDEETDDDLRIIFAPGSSLGGARPKASIVDVDGSLWIAKFPKDSDEYGIETWEEIALRLAERAEILVPPHQLVRIDGRAVFLTRRFDRIGRERIPFLSAMSMTESTDGERGRYPDVVDALMKNGARAHADAHELYRRVVFSVLVSNVDDHLRNHGFLRLDRNGWRLSPVYDLNPVPTDLKARILTTDIDLDDGTCSIDLLLASAEFYGLDVKRARSIIRAVADATVDWRTIAREVGARKAEIDRMESAFEHDEAQQARTIR